MNAATAGPAERSALPREDPKPDPDAIISTIARKHGITVQELGGQDFCQRLCRPRHEAMWALRQLGQWSLCEIGYLVAVDDRMPFDHATVLRGVRRHEERLGRVMPI